MIGRCLMGLALALALTAATPMAPALACQCIGRPIPERVRLAEIAFTGTVLSRQVHERPTLTPPPVGRGTPTPERMLLLYTGDPVTYSFRVDQVWKGHLGPMVRVETVGYEVSCGYEFEIGQSYLVEAASAAQPGADRLPGSGVLYTGLCSFTRPLSEATEMLALLGSGRAPSQPGLRNTGRGPQHRAPSGDPSGFGRDLPGAAEPR